jgi:hypothetical protein
MDRACHHGKQFLSSTLLALFFACRTLIPSTETLKKITLTFNRPYINTAQQSITRNLQGLQQILTEKSDFLKSAHLHPNTEFPWHLDAMNAQLLRKRLAPDMENWVSQGLKSGKALNSQPLLSTEAPDHTAMVIDSQPEEEMSIDNWVSLWDFAAPEASLIAQKVFPELRPEVEDEEGDDYMEGDEDEDEAMGGREDGEKAPELMPLEDILRLMSSGAKVGVGPVRSATGFAQRS